MLTLILCSLSALAGATAAWCVRDLMEWSEQLTDEELEEATDDRQMEGWMP